MPRTKHAAIYYDNLANNDLEIKNARLAIAFPTSDPAYRDLARHNLIGALQRKLDIVERDLKHGCPDPLNNRLIKQELESEIASLKRLQHIADNPPDPTDPYDEDWNDQTPNPPLLKAELRGAGAGETPQPQPSSPQTWGEETGEGSNNEVRSANNPSPDRTTEPPNDPPVGYCNPPKQHQFKPGNPGGPGRPKGSLSLRALLIQELSKHTGRISRSIAKRLIHKARNGDVKAMLAICRITEPRRNRRRTE